MLKILKFTSWIAFSLAGIFIIHSLTTYLTPFPINQINIVMLFLIWHYAYRNKDSTLWIALGLACLLELFSGLPFGLTTLAILVTLITTRTLFSLIFNNFTWLTIFLLGATTAMIADGFVYLFVNGIHFFKGDGTAPFSSPSEIISKLMLNGSILLAWYAIAKLFSGPVQKRIQF